MKEIRLFKLLNAFSTDELISFSKFIDSPFSGSTRDSQKLLKYYLSVHRDQDASKLKKPKIFKELFKDEEYNKHKIENLIYDLKHSAENFLAHHTFENDETEYLLNLSKGYLNKNLPEESKRINKEIEKLLKPSFSPEKDYISKLKRLTYLKFQCNTRTNDFNSLVKFSEDIFEISIIQFIFEYSMFVHNTGVALKDFDKNAESELVKNVVKNFDFEEMLDLFEKGDYINTPSIGLHYYRFKTILNEDNLEYYNLLKRMLLKNISFIEQEDKWFFFVYLLNYCEQKKINGVKKFEKEVLSVYKSMLESEAYSPSKDEHLDLRLCRNIIISCISLKEKEWLNYFLDNYLKYLHPDEQANMKNYGFAHFYFIENEFEKSLNYIHLVSKNFYFFKTDVRNLLLRLHYEMNNFDEAFALIDSFKHFIKENKELPEIFKIYYKNFINFYTKLIKIKSGGNKKELSFIRSEIDKNSKLINKLWFLEKADELKDKEKGFDKEVSVY